MFLKDCCLCLTSVNQPVIHFLSSSALFCVVWHWHFSHFHIKKKNNVYSISPYLWCITFICGCFVLQKRNNEVSILLKVHKQTLHIFDEHKTMNRFSKHSETFRSWKTPVPLPMMFHSAKVPLIPTNNKISAGSGYSSQQQGAVKASVLQRTSNKQAGDEMTPNVRTVAFFLKNFMTLN